jgi:peptidoglycan/xylan/chitin deacetylase (PgdA/CDA1 family)
MLKIAVISPNDTAEGVVKQLLSPWLVTFSKPDIADVIVTYETLEDAGKPTVMIPSETIEFHRWFKENKLQVIEAWGKKIKVPATETIKLSLTPKTKHFYCKLDNSRIADSESLAMQVDDTTFLLPFDIIEEYGMKLSQTLDPQVSLTYRFLTGLPIPYTLAPSKLRSFLFSARKVRHVYSYLDCLDLDALRYLLVRGIEKAIREHLQRKTWKGHKCACLITHDVDSREGLRRALALKRIEERYDIQSAWFLPTAQYKLDSGVLLKLANHGEVGAHGTRHDGKLIRISKEGIVRRLGEAKRVLENIVGQDIAGFRAPLLQHNGKVFDGLLETGYVYDSSVPTWEPRHPSCMGPYGIGTVYPLDVGGIVEVPVTVPQDHQMIRILGLNPKQTVEKWLEMKDIIKELGGVCTFLMHPDYELAEISINVYEELVSTVASDDEAFITIPSEIARSQNANPG